MSKFTPSSYDSSLYPSVPIRLVFEFIPSLDSYQNYEYLSLTKGCENGILNYCYCHILYFLYVCISLFINLVKMILKKDFLYIRETIQLSSLNVYSIRKKGKENLLRFILIELEKALKRALKTNNKNKIIINQ